MGKGLPLLGRWGNVTYLRVSHTFPVVTVLRLSSHLPPFRDMAPLFFTQLSGAVKEVNQRPWAAKNVTSRIYFPDVTHTSWGDAGSKLCSFAPFPGERISLSPCCICKASHPYQMINTPTGLIICIYPPCTILPFLLYPS